MKLKKNFHPRMFGFAGFSGAGKTTLIEKLIKAMSSYHIGYIKHDAHKFQMDHPGKDTHRQYLAGAGMVFINDSDHFNLQVRGESFTLEKEYFKDCDLVFVEGHKYADHPKFLFLDSEEQALKEYQEGKLNNVEAFILENLDQSRPVDKPFFHRDDVEGLMKFIRGRIEASVKSVELYGLILAGGESSRMGSDKSLLNYHGLPQTEHLYNLAKEINLPSYISCKPQQMDRLELSHLPIITDRFSGFGPLGGILSAMATHPDKAWLVVACDLPLLTTATMNELILARDPLKQATAYFNQERKQFEPLFAIYEPGIYSRMLHFLGEGFSCPQKVLYNSSVKVLPLTTQGKLQNVNTPEDRVQVLKILETESL